MATSCTSGSTSRRIAQAIALAAATFAVAGRSYAYARRTLTLAGVVVDNRVIRASRWPAGRFPVNERMSIPAQALERFCALENLPAR